jgi:hypothetical protein
MGTDFFDDDLLQPSLKPHGMPEQRANSPGRSSSEASVGKMAQQKEEMSNQVAAAVQEIEHLRMKQEDLEREKNKLQELGRKQEEYERDKKDVIEKIDRGIITAEKEEVEATRMVELLSETRVKFKNMLAELRNINEDSWVDENFEAELNRASAMVENARMDYKKALARVDASSWHKGITREQSELLEGVAGGMGIGQGFGHWLKIGIAMTLPLIVMVILVFIIYLAKTTLLVK